MKQRVPLALLQAMAAAPRQKEKKPRRQYNRCRHCKNPCRTDLCFKCEQKIDREIRESF